MKTNAKKPLTSDVSLLKQINFVRILSLLRYYPRLTRAEIARRNGLTRSTVTVITAELIEAGLLREGHGTVSGADGGRPGVELELNPEELFYWSGDRGGNDPHGGIKPGGTVHPSSPGSHC